ncbi:hypothetical protein MKX03_010512 [Papaver bracteatum]|nr:hypothetical protein MKX03_010512 [Papaver bracteatum]
MECPNTRKHLHSCRMSIPWDILLDILIRLPLKSIVRFSQAQNEYAVEMGKFNIMIHHHNDIYTFNYNSSLSTCEELSHIKYPVESILFGIEDFEVVHLREALHDGWCEVQVYTLKENSWRINDSFHWIVQVERSNFLDGFFLLRFEFETEEFNAVIRVRELKDSEEEESWTKLFTIEIRKHFRPFAIHDAGSPGSTFVYVESLFSLGTGTYLGQVQWEASHEEYMNDSSFEDDYDKNNGGGSDGEEE